MSITFVDSNFSTPTSSLTSTMTVSKPTGLAVGDLMLAFVAANKAGIGAPSVRWTRLSTIDAPSDQWRFEVWYCVATSSETAASNFQFTDGDNSSPAAAAICAYRGVDPANPINTSGVSSVITTTSTTQSTPTLTTTQQSLIVYARSCRLSSGTASFVSGTGTERIDSTNSGTGAVNYPIAAYDTGSDQAAGSIPAVTITRTNGTQTDSVTTAVALQMLITNVSVNMPTPPGATAAAYDAVVLTGISADAVTATSTSAAYDIKLGVQGILDPTARAYDATVSLASHPTAEVAQAVANAGINGVHYGAPPSRTYTPGAESRGYTPASESRLYLVENRKGSDGG